MSARDLAAGPVASLSNLGGLGVDSFTGIIPAGQKLLLTTGTIADRPVGVDGLVTVRPSFAATLNVDHRHFDGDNAARILAAFQSAPSWLQPATHSTSARIIAGEQIHALGLIVSLTLSVQRWRIVAVHRQMTAHSRNAHTAAL